jgi:arginine deiminase
MVRVGSEIGALEAVICHTPGAELLAITPSTREDFLYDDIIDLEKARREHHRFKAILSRFCEVYEVRDLLEEIVDEPEVRPFLIERVMDVARSEPLARQLLEIPAAELVSLFIEGREVDHRRGDYLGKVMCFFEIGDGKGTLLQFDYEHPPRPPKPNRLWHLGKIVFNKTYWHTVPKGRV